MKQINDLWLFGAAVFMLIIILLFNRCTVDSNCDCYYEYGDRWTEEYYTGCSNRIKATADYWEENCY